MQFVNNVHAVTPHVKKLYTFEDNNLNGNNAPLKKKPDLDFRSVGLMVDFALHLPCFLMSVQHYHYSSSGHCNHYYYHYTIKDPYNPYENSHSIYGRQLSRVTCLGPASLSYLVHLYSMETFCYKFLKS